MKEIIDKLSNTWINTLFVIGSIKPKKLKTAIWFVLAAFVFVVIVLYLFFKFIPDSSIIFTKTFNFGLSDFLASDSDSTFGSTILISFIGTLIGAGSGALIAAKIAERSERTKEALKQLREAKISYALSFNNFLTLIAFKAEYMNPTVKEYWKERAEIVEILEGRNPNPKSSLAARHSPPPEINLKDLNHRIFEHLNIGSRVISSVHSINRAFHALNIASNIRKDLLEEVHSMMLGGEHRGAGHIFAGYSDKEGNEDYRFQQTIHTLIKTTDDLIFHSYLLCEDLHQYRKKIFMENKKILKKYKIDIKADDFEKHYKSGLIPQLSDYQVWLAAFPDDNEPSLLKKPWNIEPENSINSNF